MKPGTSFSICYQWRNKSGPFRQTSDANKIALMVKKGWGLHRNNTGKLALWSPPFWRLF